MYNRILTVVAAGMLVCMPLAAQRNKNGAGMGAMPAMPMNGPRAVSTNSIQSPSPGTTVRTHTVTNPAGSVTRTATRSGSGWTRTMVNTEGNKTLTLSHSKMGRTHTRTRSLVHKQKAAKVNRGHRTKSRT